MDFSDDVPPDFAPPDPHMLLDLGWYLESLIDKVYDQEVLVFKRVEETLAKALSEAQEQVTPVKPHPKKNNKVKELATQSRTTGDSGTLTGSLTPRADALRYQRLLTLLHLFYEGTSLMFGIDPRQSQIKTIGHPKSEEGGDDGEHLEEMFNPTKSKDTKLN